MVSPFFEVCSSDAASCYCHQLVEDAEFEFQFYGVGECLERVRNAGLIEIIEEYDGDIEEDYDYVDVNEIEHHAPLADAGFEV